MVEYFKSRLKPATTAPYSYQRPVKRDWRLHFLSIDESDQRKYEEYGAAPVKLFTGTKDIEDTFF